MSKNKGISLNHELRGLLEARLRESISDEDFLVKTRAISTKASNHSSQVGTKPSSVTEEEVNPVKLMDKNI